LLSHRSASQSAKSKLNFLAGKRMPFAKDCLGLPHTINLKAQMFNKILPFYGIDPTDSEVNAFGDGLINHTWNVKTGTERYILQQVNQHVFKNPFDIDHNITLLKDYLDIAYPDYLFIAAIKDLSGHTMIQIPEGFFRMFRFVENSQSISVVHQYEEAYEGARQFGKFSKLLSGFDASQLRATLPDFHNLILRYQQFLYACENASAERKERSAASIAYLLDNKDIVDTFNSIIQENEIPLRVIHHDTKISNVLFDAQNKGLCVIDLDTVMSGYFISDVGDMIRTYVCPVSEEETDISKIEIRTDFFKAIYDGYIKEMGSILTDIEKSYFIYAGKFLIYMQALRFLADYLQNDVYYGSKYEGHNLCRAKNQIVLLQKYLEKEVQLKELTAG
jgi:Ser/Thr protein kinase RdoA (MazF antagonist)